MIATNKGRREGIGGMHQVDYLALVPLGYDARRPQTTEVKVRDPKKGGPVSVITETVRVTWETDSTAMQFSDHACTSDGRWVPLSFVLKNPEPGQLLIVSLKVDAKPKRKNG